MVELSVVIPLYNRAWSIGECLRSIPLPDDDSVEVIVVDDGSEDGSADVARQVARELGAEDRIKVLQQENAGPGAARNTGAAQSRGDWLVLLDSDDLWLPWTIDVLREELARTSPETGMVFLGRSHFTDPAELHSYTRAAVDRRDYSSFYAAVEDGAGITFGSCNVALRRAAFETVGGFVPSLRAQEDTDLFLRIGGPTTSIMAPTLVAIRTIREDSLTGNVAYMVQGIDWLVAQDARGVYPGDPHDRALLIGRRLVRRLRDMFAMGYPGPAYRLYARHVGCLVRAGLWRYVWRSPLIPLLHLIRPQNHPFRLNPRK